MKIINIFLIETKISLKNKKRLITFNYQNNINKNFLLIK